MYKMEKWQIKFVIILFNNSFFFLLIIEVRTLKCLVVWRPPLLDT
jgi:hypothetical protein